MTIKSTDATYKIEFKNEYLVLLNNDSVQVTCPDFICVVDTESQLGLNNGDNNKGKRVKIYAKPAITQWRTEDGLALFTPQKLGLDYNQKVI